MKTCSKKNQNMLEAISKHARRNASETLKLKMKHPYTMFQLCNLLIINDLKCKNETWNKIKTDKVNVTYARVRGNVSYVYSSGDVTMGKLQFVSHTIHYSSPSKNIRRKVTLQHNWHIVGKCWQNGNVNILDCKTKHLAHFWHTLRRTPQKGVSTIR